MFAYIGRQAIYNPVCNIAGYELLYRRNSQGGAAVQDMDGGDRARGGSRCFAGRRAC